MKCSSNLSACGVQADKLEKDKVLGEDQAKDLQTSVQELTDDYIKQVRTYHGKGESQSVYLLAQNNHGTPQQQESPPCVRI